MRDPKDHTVTYVHRGREGERWCLECDTPVLEDHGTERRGRGRPPMSPEQRRHSKLVVFLTGDEMTDLIVAATETKDELGRPTRVNEWARQILLNAAKYLRENR